MRLWLLLLPLLVLAACTDSETETVSDPPVVGQVAGPEAEPPVVRGADEVVRIDPTLVGVATVEDSLDTYDVDLEQMNLMLGEVVSEVDSAAVYEWLARFAPLEADGTYDDLDPASFELDYTSLVTFLFEDGSVRTLYVQKQTDGLAVVSQLNGTVWRVAPEALRDIVPTAASLGAR